MLYGVDNEEGARDILDGYRNTRKEIEKRIEVLYKKLKQFN